MRHRASEDEKLDAGQVRRIIAAPVTFSLQHSAFVIWPFFQRAATWNSDLNPSLNPQLSTNNRFLFA
jgi:hypothetical protein